MKEASDSVSEEEGEGGASQDIGDNLGFETCFSATGDEEYLERRVSSQVDLVKSPGVGLGDDAEVLRTICEDMCFESSMKDSILADRHKTLELNHRPTDRYPLITVSSREP